MDKQKASDLRRRIKGLSMMKAIVYGNKAHWFGGKRDSYGNTHLWILYVKPYLNEDMSAYVEKVEFKLHHSVPNPNRTITKPPYKIVETGWGEFDVIIKIHFRDPAERPVVLNHTLRLYESDVTGPKQMDGNTTEPPRGSKFAVVSEAYDEIVFSEPTQLMQHCLNSVQPITSGPYVHHTDFEAKKAESLKNIRKAKQLVKLEIISVLQKLNIAREMIPKYKKELAKVQNQ